MFIVLPLYKITDRDKLMFNTIDLKCFCSVYIKIFLCIFRTATTAVTLTFITILLMELNFLFKAFNFSYDLCPKQIILV